MFAGAHLPQRNKVFSRKSIIVYLMVYFMVKNEASIRLI